MLNQFGTYRAVVINNQDPLSQNRVLLQIPQVLGGAVSEWAKPYSYYPVPPVNGAQVWASFDGGDTRYPIYSSPTSAPTIPPTPVPLVPQYSTLGSGQPVYSTLNTYVEYTSSVFAPLTVNLGPSHQVFINIVASGFQENAGATLWLGVNTYDGTGTNLIYGANDGDSVFFQATANGTTPVAMPTIDGSKTSVFYFAGYSTIVLKPCWKTSAGPGSPRPLVGFHGGRLLAIPLAANDYSGTVH